jgi:outer membrane protein assembly factor BamB
MRFQVLLLCLLIIGCGNQRQTPPADRAGKTEKRQEASGKNRRAKQSRSAEKTLRVEPPGSDWPGFLGPAGTSVSPEKGIIAPWPKKGLRVVWEKEVGTGYGMPSISKGQLFQFDRHDDQARLSCLESRTGKQLWKFEYPSDYSDYFGYNNGPRCCPVVDRDRVYIFGAEGMLHCVRASTGKMIWKVDTKARFNVLPNFFGVASVPVVEGNLLIVQVGGSPKDSRPEAFMDVRGDRSGVVAFDKYTGKVKYQVTNELASYASPVLATIEGRRWCFVFARGGLIGFEPAGGKVDFHFPWRAPVEESVNASNPVVAGDRIFISETYGPGSALLKVKPGSYKVLWSDARKRPRQKSLQCHWNTPIYHNGFVYGSSGRHSWQAELRCVELASGKIMWRRPDLTRTSLLMVDGHFICLCEDGRLLLLKVNPHRYEEVSRMESDLLKEPCWAAPILSHGLLYVRGKDRLVCLELIPAKASAGRKVPG